MTEHISRRPPPPLGDLSQQDWLHVRGPVDRFLKWCRHSYSGLPGGYKNLTPLTVKVGGIAQAGSMQAGWMSALAQLVMGTGVPSGLGNANAAGNSELGPRLDHVHKRDVRIMKAGVDVGTRNAFNIIQGSNMTITATDNPGADRVDVTFASSGGGGSSDYEMADLEYLAYVL